MDHLDSNYYEDDVDLDLDDDEVGDNDDDGLLETESLDHDPPCEVITEECLSAAQKEDMKTIMELLHLKEHHARTLLIHYRWDVNKVSEVLVEKGKERLCFEASVDVLKTGFLIDPVERPVHVITSRVNMGFKTLASVMAHDDGDIASVQSSSPVLCEICMEEVPLKKMTKMDCNHCFCNNCWTEHFMIKINEGQSRRISCMTYKCDVICEEDKIREYVSEKDPELANKFDRFLLESYIEDNKRVKWCPSLPHCGNAIRVKDDEYCEVECACGFQFCFNCSSEAHSPCQCQMWELWNKKCQDESENVNWLTAYAKTCPKCYKAVEKNGGCNLVVCLCGQPFCWLGGEATGLSHTWTSIKNHTCRSFKEEQIANAKRLKSELIRYTHYYNHYKTHTDSLKAEVLLQKNLMETKTKLESRDLVHKDYSWLTDGADRLSRSRKFLAYSYPFAYYMFNHAYLSDEMTKVDRNSKKNLFEDQQQQLATYIERLSHFLEEPFDDGTAEEVLEITRTNIINLSRVSDNLCKHLYNCIDNEILYYLTTSINIAPYRSKGANKAKPWKPKKAEA
nr:probable E3 ubiquitin-protein ligase ARI2 [Tanacetum cinerariifolium]